MNQTYLSAWLNCFTDIELTMMGKYSQIGALDAEKCAIRSWSEVCDYTVSKDHKTYEIAQRILGKEIEHEAWLVEPLSKRPSAHLRRAIVGQSEYCIFGKIIYYSLLPPRKIKPIVKYTKKFFIS